MDASGRITFTPNVNFNGTGQFSCRIEDGHGGSSLGTMSVSVLPVNDVPVASDASLRTSMGTTITGMLPASDPDQALTTLGLAVIGQPANGTVRLEADGSYTYRAGRSPCALTAVSSIAQRMASTAATPSPTKWTMATVP